VYDKSEANERNVYNNFLISCGSTFLPFNYTCEALSLNKEIKLWNIFCAWNSFNLIISHRVSFSDVLCQEHFYSLKGKMREGFANSSHVKMLVSSSLRVFVRLALHAPSGEGLVCK
jgi:hypothetical protein